MAKEGYFGENSKTPSFLNSKKSSFADPVDTSFANHLRSAEQNATKSQKQDIKSSENNPNGFYTGAGDAPRGPAARSRAARAGWMGDTARQDPRSTAAGPRAVRKGIPLVVTLLLFGAGGFAIMNSNSLLGPHISALTSSNTNMGRTAITETEGTILGWLSKKGLLPKSLQQRFINNGATSATGSTIEYNGQTLSGDTIANTAKTNVEFNDVVNNSTRSNVLDYHDTSANQTYTHLSQSRNIFKDYKSTGNSDTDQANYDSLRTTAAGSDTSSVRLNTAEDVEQTDPETGEVLTTEDGTPLTERTSTGSDASAKTASGADASAKTKNLLSSTANKVASKVNVACAAWQVGNMISTAVAAAELYASINYFHNTIESISKMQDGEGASSGINETMNLLTKTTTETVTDARTGEEISVTGSAVQSEWGRSNLGNVKPNTDNSSRYAFERLGVASLGILGSVFTNKQAATTCNISRAASAAISLGAILTGGVISTFVGSLLSVAVKIGVSVAISGVLAAFVPIVAKALFTNTYKEYESGIPAGEEFGRGAMASNARISRTASGLTAASEENSLAYQKLQAETVARESELDRYRRSPFDASSPNTFLGSILGQFAFVPVFNGSSLLSTITSGNLLETASSIASATSNSLNRNVSAVVSTGNSYLTTYGDCPYQKDIGATCEMYDNTLLAADPSTFSITPDDPTYQKILAPSLTTDENGNEKIKDNSPLAQFISYYLDRDSIEGVYDVNIEKACQTSLGVVGQNLPVVGEILDLVNTAEAATCSDIATGERYIYSKDNPRWDSEIKYYSAYVRINRTLERLDYFKENNSKNPVVAYREHYAEEHPLDNSQAGTLARISGLSKDDAETVIAFAEYYEFLENYDPTETYAFVENNTEFSTDFSTSYTPVNTTFILIKNSKYDRRREGITA